MIIKTEEQNMQNPTFTKNEYREEYEVKDATGKCRGFIWQFKDHWAIRIDDNVASYQNTLPDAKQQATSQI